MINITNKRLLDFYESLSKAYPTVTFSTSVDSSEMLTFTIDYDDINNLTLSPVIKATHINKLSIVHLNVAINKGKKCLVGAVNLKDISKTTDNDIIKVDRD